jgi:glycerol-3-phosphate O-acyltransferase 3/4
MPAWLLGIVARYCVLLPLRTLCLLLGFVVFFLTFPLVKLAALTPCGRGRTQAAEVALVQMLASAFVASWHGVVRFHGIRPTAPEAGKGKAGAGARQGIFVANHSSMIDFIILLQSHPYAVVGQKHGGWVGFMQVRKEGGFGGCGGGLRGAGERDVAQA